MFRVDFFYVIIVIQTTTEEYNLMLALINLLMAVIIISLIMSQVILPSLRGTVLFPALRKKLRVIEKQKDELRMNHQVQEASKSLDELKKTINSTEGTKSE